MCVLIDFTTVFKGTLFPCQIHLMLLSIIIVFRLRRYTRITCFQSILLYIDFSKSFYAFNLVNIPCINRQV